MWRAGCDAAVGWDIHCAGFFRTWCTSSRHVRCKGSLAGHGVTNGIFITTSYFAPTARAFVLRGSSTKIVLIDGKKLLDLMLTHQIGVRTKHEVKVYELDQNYFDDE